MPTREQLEGAVPEIERALSDHPKDPTMQFVRMQGDEWPGFYRDEQLMVIGRVLMWEPRDRWMNGLDKEMGLEEIEATPGWKHSKEMEDYLDRAPEREIDSYYEWAEAQDAADRNRIAGGPRKGRCVMPTPEQRDGVRRKIEELEAGRFRADGTRMRPSDDPGDFPWDKLTESERSDLLHSQVNWTGFDEDQMGDVLARVVDGEAPDFWLGGIGSGDRMENLAALAAEIRADEHAARVRDFGEADAAAYPARMAEADRLIERTIGPILDWPAITNGELVGLEASFPANDNRPPDPAREGLLAETFRLNREIGFAGFREQYFEDADAIKEWPDRAEREEGLREAWDGEADLTAYRSNLADVTNEQLAEYRDALALELAGPKAGRMGHHERAAESGHAPAVPPSRDDRLKAAAEYGANLPGSPDQGLDR